MSLKYSVIGILFILIAVAAGAGAISNFDSIKAKAQSTIFENLFANSALFISLIGFFIVIIIFGCALMIIKSTGR